MDKRTLIWDADVTTCFEWGNHIELPWREAAQRVKRLNLKELQMIIGVH